MLTVARQLALGRKALSIHLYPYYCWFDRRHHQCRQCSGVLLPEFCVVRSKALIMKTHVGSQIE
jgi:hypothetical protein